MKIKITGKNINNKRIFNEIANHLNRLTVVETLGRSFIPTFQDVFQGHLEDVMELYLQNKEIDNYLVKVIITEEKDSVTIESKIRFRQSQCLNQTEIRCVMVINQSEIS